MIFVPETTIYLGLRSSRVGVLDHIAILLENSSKMVLASGNFFIFVAVVLLSVKKMFKKIKNNK